MSRSWAFIWFLVLMAVLVVQPVYGRDSGLTLTREAGFKGPHQIEVRLSITGDEGAVIDLLALGLEEVLPEGCAYNGLYEEYYGAAGKNPSGEKNVAVKDWGDRVEFYWIQIPVFPVKLVYGLNVNIFNSSQTISGAMYAYTEQEWFKTDSPVTTVNAIKCLTVEREVLENPYIQGQTMAVKLQIDSLCEEPVSVLQVVDDSGMDWVLKSAEVSYPGWGGTPPLVDLPQAGSVGPFEFTWDETPPVFPLLVTYVMDIPLTAAAPVTLQGQLFYALSGTEIIDSLPSVTLEAEAPVVEGEGETVIEGENEGELQQTASISGVVRNADTGLPLADVMVSLKPGAYQDVTGTLGVFSFAGITVGAYTLTATKEGFDGYSAGITLASGINLRDIQLEPRAVEGEGEGVVEGENEGEPQQTASLSGVVRNTGTGLPLAGTVLVLTPGDLQFTTGTLGFFSYADLVPGAYVLAATRSGYQHYSQAIVLAPGINLLNVSLTPLVQEGELEGEVEGEVEGEGEGEPEGEAPQLGSLSGVVRNAVTGLPESDALVTVMPGNYQATTGILGTFLFSDLAPGTYALKVTKTEFADFNLDVEVTAGINLQNILLQPVAAEGEGEDEGEGEMEGETEGEPQPTASLSGVVRNAVTGLPESDALVTVQPGNYQVTTGILGTFLFSDLAPGTYALEATKTEFADFNLDVEVTAGINLQNILLQPVAAEGEGEGEGEGEMEGETEGEPQPTASLSGVVRNADTGLPLAETVLVLTPGDFQFTTGTLGFFSYADLFPGTYVLTATRSGYQEYSESVVIAEGINLQNVLLESLVSEGESEEEGEGEGEPEGEAPQLGSLSGVVRNAVTGLPESGALVTVQPGDYQDTTGALGTFSFSNLSVGTYAITVKKTDFTDYTLDVDVLEGINLQNILLQPVAAEGEGEGEGEGEMEGETEGEGEPEGEPMQMGSLSGIVRSDNTGLPEADVLVTLIPGNYQMTTGVLGAFSFSNLPAGDYRLTAVKTGFAEFSQDVEITEGFNLQNVSLVPTAVEGEAEGESEGEGEVKEGEAEGEVVEGEGEPVQEGESEGETPETGSLSGVVRNANTGLPEPGVTVIVAPGGLTSTTGVLGAFSFSDLTPGNYTLAATKQGFQNFSMNVAVVSGINLQNILLLPVSEEGEGEGTGEGEGEGEEVEGETGEGEVLQEGSLHGTVRCSATGLPLYDARLLLTPGAFEQRTDRRGMYRFEDLPAGTYVISVTHSSCEEYSGAVSVSPGESILVDITLTSLGGEGEGEGEVVEGEHEGESEGEGEGEACCGGCCASSKAMPGQWQRHLADLFLLGLATMMLSRFYKK
ncbi:MAG TPA: carboxypeptidase regulatory-like domain-containing protein [Candidatus Hydrogenedentes bacterium]|nr:carboxypeptidase regulatory-like domain-containing protein [Candidatus Hydrogenedentota bacterium]